MTSNNSKIFVSIACYMDKDVINTIDDCLAKAKNSANINFGVCLQFDPEDKFFEKYENHPQVKIKRMHWKEAKGPMYARYFCTKLVSDEEYFLQIDCHTRFYQDWDEIIVEELHKCEKLHDKCVISHYPLNINNMNDEKWKSKMGIIKTFRYINVDSIKSHGSLQNTPKEPTQSYGIMAALKFMRVSALKEVPYDLKTYHGYHGEEQFYYSVRLYTNGYNCYAPTRHILAMEYVTNRNRLSTESKSHLCKDSHVWNQRTWRKCKYYLRLDTLEKIDCQEYVDDIFENQKTYGLGNVRSVIDYYKFAGIHEKLLELFPFYKNYVSLKFHNDDFTHLLEIYNPGKKIAIVTQNTPNLIRHYYKEARENHIMYCNKHDYSYYVFYDNLAEDVNPGESPKISWSKVKACLNVVENHDYTMWMDADAIYANQNIKIEDKINEYPEKDYYLCRDPKSHFVNSGVMIWKNSEKSISMLNRWWDSDHISYGKGGDQKPLGDFLKVNKNFNNQWHHFGEREMNCYPTNSFPYDYIIHFMGVKSKINIKQRLNNWNYYLKNENNNINLYVSLTTIPDRYYNLHLVLKNILSGKYVPKKIIINLPKKYLVFESNNHVETLQKLLHDHNLEKYAEINLLENDYGPIMKYTGICNYVKKHDLLKKENFGVVVLDDDLLYRNYVLEEYVNYNLLYPRTILTFYHMSKIRCGIDFDKSVHAGQPYLIKGADSIFLPKYFFLQDSNPSLEEVVINSMNDYKHCGFMDDYFITAFCYYKHMEKKSINYRNSDGDGAKCYGYTPRKKNEYGVSNFSKNKFNHQDTIQILNQMNKYFMYEKYSNVKFQHNAEKISYSLNQIEEIKQKKNSITEEDEKKISEINNHPIVHRPVKLNHNLIKHVILNYTWNFKPGESQPRPPDEIIDNNGLYFQNCNVIEPKHVEKYFENNNDFDKDLYDLYHNCSSWVVKSDLARYMYIYYNGGFYCDADCMILKPIPIDNTNEAYVFIEKIISTVNKLRPRECKDPENVTRICNYFFGTTVKQHPFFKDLIQECIKRMRQIFVEEGFKIVPPNDVYWICGPDAFTTTYHRNKRKYSSLLLLNEKHIKHHANGSWKNTGIYKLNGGYDNGVMQAKK